MLYVKYIGRDGYFDSSNGIHVGNGKKTLEDIVNRQVDDIVSIQADGDELEAIINQFANLLYSKQARVQTFRGETAQFIYEHLKL